MRYRIGELPLILDGDAEEDPRFFPDLSGFCRDGEEVPAADPLRITVRYRDRVVMPETVDFRVGHYAFSRTKDGVCAFCETSDDAMITMKRGEDSALLFVQKKSKSDLQMNMLQFAFSSFLAKNNGIFLHGAVLSYRGSGVIFTAPSGGGKTTHTDLWLRRYEGASLLNGDKAIVRMRGGVPTVYGSPWAGSGNTRIDRWVPLRAIVVLEKAKENRVIRADAALGTALVSRGVYYPYWDEDGVAAVLSTMDEVLSRVPVYRLFCLPDLAAAEVAHDALFPSDPGAEVLRV